MIPPIEPLREVVDRLQRAGVTCALGGTGLLHALGLLDDVADWDLTTDAEWNDVEPALRGLTYQMGQPTERFRSRFICQIELGGAWIEVLGGFAIVEGEVLHEVPTRVSASWDGIPLASPEDWLVAYRKMGRLHRAELLERCVLSTRDRVQSTQ